MENTTSKTTFETLPFKPFKELGGVCARVTFDNGYGASVVKHAHSYGGNADKYELAVLGPDGRLCYSTPITNDVLGWLEPEEVTEILGRIAALPKAGAS